MPDCRVLVLSILLPLGLQLSTIQSGADESKTTALVSVEAPLEEAMQGYLRWIGRHPEAIPRPQKPIPGLPQGSPNRDSEADRGVDPLQVRMPSIDLYAPSGFSLYHGVDSEKNAAFIRALTRRIAEENTPRTNETRPTLREAIEMFAELKTYKVGHLEDKVYTLFALTYPDTVLCKAQNEAIQEIKNGTRRIGIRVIEVRLHK